MEIALTEPIEQPPIAEPPPVVQQKKSGRGGARPNSGGARPNSGPKKKPDQKHVPEKWKLVDEADLPEARRKLLVLPPIPVARNNRPQELLKWWTALTEDHLSHLAIYVYRLWPMIRSKQVGPTEQSNIKIMTGPCPFSPDTWELDIMREFGSGDYRFSVNEDSVHRADVYVKTTRDLERFPPMLDYRMLAIDDPSNKEYIAWARMRGLLEGIGLHNEENDMASAAVEQMSAVIERQSDRMMDLADRVAEKGERNASGGTEGKLVDMVMEVSKRANETAMDAVRNASAQRDQQANPLELIDRIISVAGTLSGGGKGDSAVITLMQQMVTSSEKRAERMEQAMDNMREARRNPDDEEGSGGMVTQLEKLRGMKDLLIDLGMVKSSTGEQADAANALAESSKNESMKSMLLKMAMQNLPGMIGPGGINALLGNLVNIVIAMKQGPPAPAAPGQPPHQPAALNPQPTAPAPAPVVMLAGFPMPAVTGNVALDEIMIEVWRFTPTFIHHLNTETLNGYSFARWLIDSNANGRTMYDMMRDAEKSGPGTIKTIMIEGYPPLRDAVTKTLPGSAPDSTKLDQFLVEFLRLDDWEKEEADEDDEEDETPEVSGAVLKT